MVDMDHVDHGDMNHVGCAVGAVDERVHRSGRGAMPGTGGITETERACRRSTRALLVATAALGRLTAMRPTLHRGTRRYPAE